MDYLNDENDLNNRKLRDFADLQNEIAGRDTGRIARFLTADRGGSDPEKKKRAERRFRDALEALLATDPEYRALYIELGEKLGDAETNADETIAALQDRLASLNDAITNTLDRAARLPDGRRVFRYADGHVEDEFGNAVSPELAEGIQWPPKAPSAEEYFALLKARDDMQALLAAWLEYRNETLGTIRDRYDDHDRPMDKDDLKKRCAHDHLGL